jgi:uncharacterized protein (TIGR02147 family)
MRKYSQAMQLSQKETDYFEALVGFNNSTSNGEKNRYFGEMVRLRGRSAVKFLDVKQYEYFSNWYNPVIREMIVNQGVGNDPDAISRKIVPTVSPAKVRKSIALLKELGIIFQDEQGNWKATDTIISSEYEIESVALKNYHSAMLDLAKQAIEEFPSHQRELQGLTLSASAPLYARIKERTRIFTDEILAMIAAEKEKADVVFQLNIQQFPFTKQDGAE